MQKTTLLKKITTHSAAYITFAAILLTLLCLTNSASAFNITSIALYDDENGATTNPTTAMTPADEMTLTFNITDASLKELSITIYDSAQTTKSACYNTDIIESASRCAWVEWKNNSGEELFASLRPTQTSWAIDKPNSLITTSSLSRFVFTPAKSSRYTDASTWTIHIRANNGTEERTRTLTLNNTYYLIQTVSKSSVLFEPGQKNTVNHHLAQLESNGYDLTYIPLTIISNAPYNWKAKSTNFTGAGTINVEASTLGAALTDTPQNQLYLNTTYIDIQTSHPPTTDSGDQKQLFLWLDYPPGDPDTTYTASLSLQAYITSNTSHTATESTVSMSAGTDNTKPGINIIAPLPLAWTKNGHTIDYSINVTDTLSGFMNSYQTKKCKIYFGGTLVSQTSVQKNPTYNISKCTGSFTVPQTGNKNVNLNITLEDMAGNFAYNDTLWLQLDQSSLDISDIALVSTSKPNDLDWYFLASDTLRIVGHIKNQAEDAVNTTLTSWLDIPGAAVTVNSSAISSSSPYTINTPGNIDIEYFFTSSNIGPATLYLTAKDQMNNTATYNKTFHITNYLNSITILTNFTDKIYSQGDNISIELDTNTDAYPVCMANITATLKDPDNNAVRTIRAVTDAGGKAQFYIDIPKTKEEYYTLEVSGFSPIDTTKTITNTTTINTEWLDIEVNIHTPGYIDTNQSTKIRIFGRLDYSDDPGNNTIVEGAAVTCLIKGPHNYNDTDTTTLNSTGEYNCNGLKNITKAGKYHFEISAQKTINNFKISGWNKEEYVTITNISELHAILTNTTQPTDTSSALIITSYPEKISLEQGKSTLYNLTIKNTGDTILKNITLKLESKDTDAYHYSGTIPELKENKEILLQVNIISSNTSKTGSYNMSIYLESCNGTNTSISFLLDILYGDAEKQRIKTNYTQLKTKIHIMRRSVNTLLPSKNENIQFLDSKLKAIEKLLNDLELALEKNDYLAADSTIYDIELKLHNLEDTIQDEIEKQNKTTRKNIIMAIIIIIIILLAALIYYMWLPAKSTNYEFEKKDEKTLTDTKNIAKQKIREYLEKLKHNLKENPKYNYHRKDRWSSS
ncbi:MAG: hypothetical protein DRN71_01940 [Candidatus Nanohalarchaeota archaeon]|nr:MAG: hypothetical protein DRN71_01940 [Candidatus Nanohaloarchaeota archaeon]